jgi:four helix bundle protein
MAYGSNCELDTQLSLAGDLGYINGENLKGLQAKLGEVERMLMALIRSLENKLLESV